jgi:phosphocarrier protein
MKERIFEIKNRLGLHARPAAMFVQLCSKYKSKVKVMKEDQEVDGKSIMGLLTLAAGCGNRIRVITNGEDEEELLNELEDLIERKKFDEE